MADSIPRTVDAPPRTYSTTEQAAEWLGWTANAFRRAAAEQSAWLGPSGVSGPRGAQLWYWFDVVTLANIYRRQGPPRAATEAVSEDED